MRKFFSFLVVGFVALLPFYVSAAKVEVEADEKYCERDDVNSTYTCKLPYAITGEGYVEEVKITLTEQGGAEIISVEDIAGDDFDIDQTKSGKTGNVYTVVVTSPGSNGEGDLFTYKYKFSSELDCGVNVSVENASAPIPDDTTQTPPVDEETENEKTGVSLPFIALGAIALVAGGAYVTTKNKSKIYKI